tara:strand:- start:17 stop:412 length:396 start_codon:yes stop_codon:yes gene_type:complete
LAAIYAKPSPVSDKLVVEGPFGNVIHCPGRQLKYGRDYRVKGLFPDLARIGSLVFQYPFTSARSMSRLARLVGTTGRRIIECLNVIVIPKFNREKALVRECVPCPYQLGKILAELYRLSTRQTAFDSFAGS